MRRMFWMSLGATAGVLAVRRITAAAKVFTPDGMAGVAGSLGERFAAFSAEVREGMAEREVELREALGLDGRHDSVDIHTMTPQPATEEPTGTEQHPTTHTPAVSAAPES